MRLIIACNSATAGVSEKNALTAFLEAKQWSVWHWFDELWLLDNVPAEIKFSDLRIEILTAIPTLRHILIMTTEGIINHSGVVPKRSAEWFKEHWAKR